MIHVSHLVKSFGPSAALRGLSLSVAEGEFVTVAGPNGAGKTTLLRVLASLSRPSAGQVRIGAYNLPDQAAEVRGQIGFLGHHPLLYGDLSAEENLRFYGRIYAVAELEARIGEVLELVGLEGRQRDLVRTFSRGMQQRLAIARAVLHHPPLMLLDEPYTGLDQDAASRLEHVLSSLVTGGCTALMTTHDLERGLAVADRLVILANGRIAFEARRSEIDAQALEAAYRQHTAQ
jgi:heme exporter protein A